VALQGVYNSGGIAVAYAARHPERVSHLLLWCTVVDGSVPRENTQLSALRQLVQSNWELFTETDAGAFLGWSEPEAARQYAEVIRAGNTPGTLPLLVAAIHELNV
jgi:pimeloyl-ACP methyl ester carboxylesterase